MICLKAARNRSIVVLAALGFAVGVAQAGDRPLQPETSPELWTQSTRLMSALGVVDYFAQACQAIKFDQPIPNLVPAVLSSWGARDRQRLRLARMNSLAEQRALHGQTCPSTGVEVMGNFIEAQAGFLQASRDHADP
jgi:hypothetical protein